MTSAIPSFAAFFSENGYAVVDDVFNDEEIAEMKAEMAKVVDNFGFDAIPRTVFTTYNDQKHAKDEYFLESGSQVAAFFEEAAVDANGNVVVAKQLAFNKVGHALHWLNPVFKKYSFHDKIKGIMRSLCFEQPEIVQSMYIFKQPRIGGVVTSHIDATFLRASPVDRLVGIWIALDDATAENGCLFFSPGSHKTTCSDYKFARTYSKDGPLRFEGEKPSYDHLSFVPVPVKKGSAVLIHGLTVHRSEANNSEESRHAYTLHVLDAKDAEWSKHNWLQPTNSYAFPSLYDN